MLLSLLCMCFDFQLWNLGFVEQLQTEPIINEWNSSQAETLQRHIDSEVLIKYVKYTFNLSIFIDDLFVTMDEKS